MSKNIVDTITQMAVVTSIACMLVCYNHVHISSIPLDGKCCAPGQFLIEDKLNAYTTKRIYILPTHYEHAKKKQKHMSTGL